MYHVLEFNNVCSNSLFIIVEVLWKVFKKWRLKVYETVKKSTIISIATKSDIGTTERKQRKAKFKTKKKVRIVTLLLSQCKALNLMVKLDLMHSLEPRQLD